VNSVPGCLIWVDYGLIWYTLSGIDVWQAIGLRRDPLVMSLGRYGINMVYKANVDSMVVKWSTWKRFHEYCAESSTSGHGQYRTEMEQIIAHCDYAACFPCTRCNTI
jgi:hypothetical protein